MSNPVSNVLPDCTYQCKSRQHGDKITAAISKRSISDMDLCAFLSYICTRCESVRDTNGRTALHVAASCGRVDLVRWLIRNRHADIDAKDKESGYTALHRSIFYGKIHVAVELTKLGASVTELDHDNLTMLEHTMKDGLKPEISCGGEIYSWGSNINNLLGPQGARESPEILDIFHKEFPNECVQQICIDQFHSVIITNSGKAFSCGHGMGGRLGLGIEKTVVSPHIINFSDSLKGEVITCCVASISRDHSIFLCSDGNIYSCGLNTNRVLGHQPPPERLLVPKLVRHISKDVQGVCAARYHSVAWGPEALYTWGLNGGQLGHKKNGASEEQYIVTPKFARIINFDGTSIKFVAASDGATAVCTERGDIYVLHEYLCRKIASRQLNLVQISITGGKLDTPSLNKELSKKMNWDLKVAILTNTGNLFLWQESDPQLCRCIFSVNRAIIIKQVRININEILLVTDNGEAFKGYTCQRKKKSSNVDKTSKVHEKSAFHRFLEKEDCVLLQLKKICRIHRAISIQSDPKGKDYCVIQALPYKFFAFPQMAQSEMKTHFQILMEEAGESDDIHDIVFKVGPKYFPAHSFVVAMKSPYLERLIRNNNRELIILSDVNPDIFEQLLMFIYTGSCDLTKCGEVKREGLRELCYKQIDQKEKKELLDDLEIPSDMSAYEYYNKKSHEDQTKITKTHNTKNPVRLLHELAKRYECVDLQKILTNLDMQKCVIKLKHLHEGSEVPVNLNNTKLKFDRSMFPNLYDVIFKCRDNKEIKAHKCVLVARLEYFNSMFSVRWRGSETSEVTLPFPKSIAEALLEFLYTDSLSYLDSIDVDHLFKVLVLADQLFVTRLKEQCELLLTNLLTLKNAVQLLSFSHLYNAEKLKYCCMKFIVLNITPFLELRSLDDLEDELLKELTDFYFEEKEAIACRVITPFSTAPSDEEIFYISNLYPVSLEDEVERIKIKSSQKRKSRTHKSSLSEKNNSISVDNEASLDSLIQFPDTPEIIVSCKDATVPCRLKAINAAKDVIICEEVETQFTKLTSSRTSNLCDNVTSYNESRDFPDLNSLPSHLSRSVHQKTPQKVDSKHKMVRLSQKQRKRLESESNTVQSPTTPDSPKNPWKTIADLTSPVSTLDAMHTIGDIISDEKKQKENLVKIKTKLLAFTQIEDRAIDDLHKFYNCDNITDEIITIERVTIGAIASPVWVPRTK